jgi:hypothetical protein
MFLSQIINNFVSTTDTIQDGGSQSPDYDEQHNLGCNAV